MQLTAKKKTARGAATPTGGKQNYANKIISDIIGKVKEDSNAKDNFNAIDAKRAKHICNI